MIEEIICRHIIYTMVKAVKKNAQIFQRLRFGEFLANIVRFIN